MPIDVTEYNIDVLVCAAYKWLMAPYAIGAAYYSEKFNNGTPIEESWLNRVNARDFTSLTQYNEAYLPGAARYSMGENSHFALTPAFMAALQQLLQWDTHAIQDYAGNLIAPLIDFLKGKGAVIEEDAYRASHLFGFTLPGKIDSKKLLYELQQRKIFVSVRGESVRVSTHLFNDEADINALIDAVAKIV